MSAAGAGLSPTTAPGPTTAAVAPGEGAGLGARWVAVCLVSALEPERGAVALVDGEQVALVRLLDDRVLAVQQRDPFSGAHVLSRGIVGSRLVDGQVRPTLASPMYKQVFDLETGACLDPVGAVPVDGGPGELRTWPVRIVDGHVHLRIGDDGDPGAPAGTVSPGARFDDAAPTGTASKDEAPSGTAPPSTAPPSTAPERTAAAGAREERRP